MQPNLSPTANLHLYLIPVKSKSSDSLNDYTMLAGGCWQIHQHSVTWGKKEIKWFLDIYI